MTRFWLAIVGVLVCPISNGQPLGHPIGEVLVKCPATLERTSGLALNSNFIVSPEQAVAVAETAGHVKCNSKVLQEVFADGENYYITRFGSPSIVVINGRTAAITLRERR